MIQIATLVDIHGDPIMDRVIRDFFNRYPRARTKVPNIPGYNSIMIIAKEIKNDGQINTYAFKVYRDNVAIYATASWLFYDEAWYLADPKFRIGMVLQGFLDAFSPISNYEVVTIMAVVQ